MQAYQRRKKLDALAKRLRDPIASRIDPQAYAHDRQVRMEAGASPKTLNFDTRYPRKQKPLKFARKIRGLSVSNWWAGGI
ncbi:phage integrase [Pseudomonas sp. NPDC077408]